MTDLAHDDADGDAPDTFDGRLAIAARLIDTFGAEAVPARRALRRAVIVTMLGRIVADVAALVVVELDRLDQAPP